jgi:hypothetical protein
MELFDKFLLTESEDIENSKELQFFINRIENGDFRTVHKYVNIFELFSLYEISIILHECIQQNYFDEELLKNYIEETADYYFIEDIESFNDNFSILEEGVKDFVKGVLSFAGSSPRLHTASRDTAKVKKYMDKINKFDPESKYPQISDEVKEKIKDKYNREGIKGFIQSHKKSVEDVNKVIKMTKKKDPGVLKKFSLAKEYDLHKLNRGIPQDKRLDKNFIKNYYNHAKEHGDAIWNKIKLASSGGTDVETRRMVRGGRRLALAGTGAYALYPSSSSGDIGNVVSGIKQTNVLNPKIDANNNTTEGKKKLISKWADYVKNNPGKTIGGAAAAGGLGYLAYKLWKKRRGKKDGKK